MKKKSPLKDAPLRSPGQSIYEHQVKVLEAFMLWPILIWLASFLMAMQEWIRFLYPGTNNRWLFTLLAIAATVYLLVRMFRTRRVLRGLKLGRDGEVAVGQFLERLRSDGYHVFHDVVGQGFNVDHVLIGPAGIFTIETKTYSKPAKGKSEIWFDGERITLGNWEPDRNPVIQARAQTGWLSSLLRESTGRDFPVMPVIVFPGWFIQTTGRPTHQIWVLEPKALPKYLKNEPTRLSEENVRLASYHLSRFIRSEEQRRRKTA